MAAPKKYLDQAGMVYLITKIAATFYQKPNSGIPTEDLSLAVREALSQLEHLDLASDIDPGLMSPEDKIKLDALNIHYNTTAYWNSKRGYIPAAGALIIYSDLTRVVEGDKVTYRPGLKVGTGNGYLEDLAFLGGGDAAGLLEHMADQIAHVTQEDRARWDNKLNVNDVSEVVGEELIFNRN